MTPFTENDDLDLAFAIDTDLQFWSVEQGLEGAMTQEKIDSLTRFIYERIRLAMEGRYPPKDDGFSEDADDTKD